jgi:hypothetical protein
VGAWLAHVLGLDNASGAPYLAWSGAGGDLSELALVGALLTHLRRFNCHVHGCLRLGRHPVAGTDYIVCRRHHPDGAPTAADLILAEPKGPAS